LERLDALKRELGVQIVMRSVLPGVIRIADSFANRSRMEIAYFEHDVDRTAAFLSLPYGEPNPSPVNWVDGAGWVAKPDQGRLSRLCNMLFQARQLSKEYQLYTTLMRLIWSGQTQDWDEAAHLTKCLVECDLPETLIDQPDSLSSEATSYFAANQQAMNDCGHWGVPIFSWRGEPFHGQDRLDQLRWRINSS
jgi:2-hydroxychromene-2-carboxylate isomerase